MKLSMATSSLTCYIDAGIDEKTTLQAMKDSGFTCLDYEITDAMLEGDYEQRAAEKKAMLEELGLTTPQGHAPMYNPLNPPEDIDLIDLYTRTLKFCKVIGIPQVVIHPGAFKGNTREEFFEKNVAFFRRLIPAAEETGVGVLIENIGNYADPHCLWTGADLREMLDRVDHPLFTACWDVGHANHFWPEHGNQYDSIVALGDKLTALHVHENCGYFEEPRKHHRIDMHTVPYSSVHSPLSFDAVLQGLKDIGYKGTFSFECLFPAKKGQASFVYKGEQVTRLQMLPLSLWTKANAVVYEMGKYMLETYDMFEE